MVPDEDRSNAQGQATIDERQEFAEMQFAKTSGTVNALGLAPRADHPEEYRPALVGGCFNLQLGAGLLREEAFPRLLLVAWTGRGPPGDGGLEGVLIEARCCKQSRPGVASPPMRLVLGSRDVLEFDQPSLKVKKDARHATPQGRVRGGHSPRNLWEVRSGRI